MRRAHWWHISTSGDAGHRCGESMRAMFSHDDEVLPMDDVAHPEAARMLLPEPLEVPPIARAIVCMAQYFDTSSTDLVIEFA